MNDAKVDPKKATILGAKQYVLGGFTMRTAEAPEAILAKIADRYRAMLVNQGEYEAAKDANPFMQEPAAYALAMWLSDEIKARKEVEERLGLLQGKVDALAKTVEQLARHLPEEEKGDGEDAQAG